MHELWVYKRRRAQWCRFTHGGYNASFPMKLERIKAKYQSEPTQDNLSHPPSSSARLIHFPDRRSLKPDRNIKGPKYKDVKG